MIEFIKEPWAWWVSGPIISLVMFLLMYFGKDFGVSANLRTMCSIGGAGKYADFFKFNWKNQIWNLVFIFGTISGGFLASQFLMNDKHMHIADETVADMKTFGIEEPGKEFVPEEVFGWESFITWKGFLRIMLGGFFVGFGARYAGGCTSGHAISGISNLQMPSVVAVIGFFIGGLVMTWFLLPYFF